MTRQYGIGDFLCDLRGYLILKNTIDRSLLRDLNRSFDNYRNAVANNALE